MPEAGRRPALSIVVATVEPWPELRPCLESFLDQARAVDAEVIIADGHGAALPENPRFRDIHRLKEPGASVFKLRALGLSRARGEVVAVTEDHCRASPGWCRRFIEVHRENPHALAVGGAVENGSVGSLLDRVHFLIAKGPYMKPVSRGGCGDLPGQENISYKRNALEDPFPKSGVSDFLFNRKLRKSAGTCLIDDRLVVQHFQSLGWAGTCRMHFHNGRSIAGFRLPDLSAFRLILRLASCLVLPGFLMLRTAWTVFRKKRFRLTLLRGLPILWLLAMCHTAGEFVGYLTGPGDSPLRLR
jgi:hypothetical protein